ncbi:unnamed protein product, partial [marine sediment metagenome]
FSKKEGKGRGVGLFYITKKDLQRPSLFADILCATRFWTDAFSEKFCLVKTTLWDRWTEIDTKKDYEVAKKMFQSNYYYKKPSLKQLRNLYRNVSDDVFHFELRDKKKDKKILDSSVFVSAYYKDRLIGIVRVIPDKYYPSIWDVMVRDEFQRCGIGTRLMLILIDVLKKEKPLKIFLFPAIKKEKFYNKMGFNFITTSKPMEIRLCD